MIKKNLTVCNLKVMGQDYFAEERMLRVAPMDSLVVRVDEEERMSLVVRGPAPPRHRQAVVSSADTESKPSSLLRNCSICHRLARGVYPPAVSRQFSLFSRFLGL